MATVKLERRPYTGSCHCGQIKYIIYLSFPTLPYPRTTQTEYREAGGHRIYKCNCTLCHKAGLLHIRVLDAANDFFIITPKDPFSKDSVLKDYVPAGCEKSWHFCANCGMRPFGIHGSGYSEETELPTTLLQRVESRTLNGTTGPITAKDGDMTRVLVWRPSKRWRESGDDENEEGGDYLSINGLSLDAHNDNFDLRQLHKHGYIAYMQTLETVGYDYEDEPYFGGAY